MTRVNVISRYFDDASKALNARYELVQGRKLSHKIIALHDSADGLVDKLTDGNVNADTARAYADKMSNGGAVIVVQAEYKPLGVARITREVLDEMGAVSMPGVTEEVLHRGPPRAYSARILKDHPHFLTRERDPMSTNHHMADWPLPLIIRKKRSPIGVIKPHAHMADMFYPLLMPYEPYTKSIFPRHARMADKILPLISKRKPFTGSIFSRHARMANFPLPLISRRKPRNRSIFPRHQRMATVPFPLLINGKTGTNALIPGAPRMANFPIGLLSKRKPLTGSIFSRHARMANFPIGLISGRKPYTGSIVPRHGRMADKILPLVISRSDSAKKNGGSGFSFSKMIGMPTLIRR